MDKYEPAKIRTLPSARTLSSWVRYEPSKIEPKWQKRWEEEDLYKAVDFDPPAHSGLSPSGSKTGGPKKYILIEFPYPSGERLHVGHGRSYTALDAVSRRLRMQGFNVLYPIGWDAFGLPAENYAIKTGINPQITTTQNIKNAKAQAKRWGLSFDWSREINTTDPTYYKWTQWIFLKMFEKGLAYKEEVPVSWCPSCQINLANEEVVGGKCERCGAAAERRTQSQWMLKITQYAQRLLDDLKTVDYLPQIKAGQENWIGRSEGTEIEFPVSNFQSPIKVFTTRPDTLFGVTAMVLAPEHPLVAELLNLKSQISNLKFEEIKRYVDESKRKSELERTELIKEKTGVVTGLYCLNPVNEEKIPIWIGDYVIGWYGGGAVMVVPAHDQRDFEFAKRYGIKIREVVSGGDISQAAYEEDGVLVNSGEFKGQTSSKARENITKWLKEHHVGQKVVQYKLRDWVFSRQHYWGEPIPMINCPKCGWVTVPEEDLPVELPYVEKYQPTGTGESPLAQVENWVNVACPLCGSAARRETDTMPNWAGSNWYFLRYCDPKNEKALADREKLNYWMPVDLYNGGMEHNNLHLLYSRFIYKFLFDLGVVPGDEPYARRHSHGVVLGPDGQKMSKSRGNVINPDEVVAAYGADTFRLYEMFMGPFEQMIVWGEEGIGGCYRFLKRVWQLSLEKVKEEPTPSSLVRKLHQTIRKVSEDLDHLRFNTAVAAMMELVNAWAVPSVFMNPQEVKLFLQILAPFAPHITEELWQRQGGDFSIHQSQWPKYDSQLAQEEKVTMVVQVNGKVRERLELEREKAGRQEEVGEQALASEKVKRYIAGKKIKKVIFIPGKLINFVI